MWKVLAELKRLLALALIFLLLKCDAFRGVLRSGQSPTKSAHTMIQTAPSLPKKSCIEKSCIRRTCSLLASTPAVSSVVDTRGVPSFNVNITERTNSCLDFDVILDALRQVGDLSYIFKGLFL